MASRARSRHPPDPTAPATHRPRHPTGPGGQEPSLMPSSASRPQGRPAQPRERLTQFSSPPVTKFFLLRINPGRRDLAGRVRLAPLPIPVFPSGVSDFLYAGGAGRYRGGVRLPDTAKPGGDLMANSRSVVGQPSGPGSRHRRAARPPLTDHVCNPGRRRPVQRALSAAALVREHLHRRLVAAPGAFVRCGTTLIAFNHWRNARAIGGNAWAPGPASSRPGMICGICEDISITESFMTTTQSESFPVGLRTRSVMMPNCLLQRHALVGTWHGGIQCCLVTGAPRQR
jgi:hypothetical protein